MVLVKKNVKGALVRVLLNGMRRNPLISSAIRIVTGVCDSYVPLRAKMCRK